MFFIVENGLAYFASLDLVGFLGLFWFTIIFDLPRYLFSFVVVAVHRLFAHKSGEIYKGTISVVIAGHNEENSIERCILSLREQSRRPEEIIVVSDGSTDRMSEKLRSLQQQGLIDQIHCTHLRAGKSAAINLACRQAKGDILVNVDCDCSFHRHAIKNIIAHFADPDVGAVSGNILVRNDRSSLIAAYQAVEYLISISLGKRAQSMLGLVTCVSGAFGAYRRNAYEGVNGLDVGGGEDLDLTLRLRKAGWKIDFAQDSICSTDVPATVGALIGQRFRWERDAVRLRYRKHFDLMNPFSSSFRISELLHEIEFIFFNVFAALVLPFYLAWLFLTYGDLAIFILFAAQTGLLILDFYSYILAALVTPQMKSIRLLPYALTFGLFNGLFMRLIRVSAYLEEWLFNSSAKDEYVPQKVQLLRKW